MDFSRKLGRKNLKTNSTLLLMKTFEAVCVEDFFGNTGKLYSRGRGIAPEET